MSESFLALHSEWRMPYLESLQLRAHTPKEPIRGK
jgi:hypothetical protein